MTVFLPIPWYNTLPKMALDTHLFLDKLFARLDSQDTKGLPEFLAKFPMLMGLVSR